MSLSKSIPRVSPELFRKFADLSHRDVRKQRESFDVHHELLRFPPLSQEIATGITEQIKQLKETYGKYFFEDYD